MKAFCEKDWDEETWEDYPDDEDDEEDEEY